MDATIAAAWIGAGVGGSVAMLGVVGTVVTSVVSSNNTRKATERTVKAGTDANRATLVAAREDRLWEKRAAAYEEILTHLLHRQAKRRFELRKYRTSAEEEQELTEFYETYELSGVFGTEGRLVAYASDAVMGAFNVSRGAHAFVQVECGNRGALRESATMAQRSGNLQSVPGAGTMMDAQRKIDAALEASEAADDALIKLIRDELRSRPEAAMLPERPEALLAARRRIWHRRRDRR